MKLTFLGAAGTVTGSKYLLEDGAQRYLVDCGLFQGLKELRQRNWDQLPVPAAKIDGIILTHAHLDHSGFLPSLVRNGFRGPVYCTKATRDLCGILLPDSGRIQEEDAERANRYGYTKHQPALPLYTADEAREALTYLHPVDYATPTALNEFLKFSLHRAGHILGAASVRISDGQTSLLFSGDLGRPHDPLMKAPVAPEPADYMVVESTYGNHLHEAIDPAGELTDVINRTLRRGGTLIIPAFAVGRAQALLYYVHRLKAEHRIPAQVPVYLDSPMAIDVSELMMRYPGEHRLPQSLCQQVCADVTYVHTREASRALDEQAIAMPTIIISASGMATGGRVLHHLKRFIDNPRNTVLLAGFQAAGTRGDKLARGEKEIRIHGEMFRVEAEIVKLDSMSAHADRDEVLNWLKKAPTPPRRIFITHGEPDSATALKEAIQEQLGWRAEVPDYLETVDL